MDRLTPGTPAAGWAYQMMASKMRTSDVGADHDEHGHHGGVEDGQRQVPKICAFAPCRLCGRVCRRGR